jgi:DDE family transposase
LRVQSTAARQLPIVTTDGAGLVSHAGVRLLAETADRLGLTQALGRAGRSRSQRVRHQTGRVLRDLIVMLADGGTKPCELAALRERPELLGPVASEATVSRVVGQVAADPKARAALASARTRFRRRVWQAGGRPPGDGPLLVDLDASLVEVHSDKDGAAGTYKGGFGFSPLLGFLDRGDGRGEALTGMLRPGNAAASNAADQLAALKLALLALPRAERARRGCWSASTGRAPATTCWTGWSTSGWTTRSASR